MRERQSVFSLDQCNTLTDILRERAINQTDQVAYIFLPDGETEEGNLTYGELDRRARAIAVTLRKGVDRPGKRVLLLYPPGLEYICAFWGCLYAGMVAVPCYPPRINRPDPRLQTIAQDSQAQIALTTPNILSSMEPRLANTPDLAALDWLATDAISLEQAEKWESPRTDKDTLAFLQYTSGSTAQPKGVMVSHGNLLHNLQQIHDFFGMNSRSRGVIWLPPYHDMGLIGGLLETLYAGVSTVVMPPTAFLQKPIRWLQAISRYQATISGGPNFAYELCTQKITDEQKKGLDLSRWEVAFTGAEPIHKQALERFAAMFAPCGLRRESLFACYGLAEATLIVSGSRKGKEPTAHMFAADDLAQSRAVLALAKDENPRELVSCGTPAPDQQLVIVDPQTARRCPENRVGEIWLTGPSVTQGYWNQPEETAKVFQAQLAGSKRAFLRTGDLGFLHAGEVYLVGRAKDLIIIRGRNHYPQDIELTAESSYPGLPASSGAAFSVDIDGEEKLVVVQELDRHTKQEDTPAIIAAIRQAIAEQHEVQAYAVVLIRVGTIPRTSSFKIRRQACRGQFLDKTLVIVASSTLDTEVTTEETSPELSLESILELAPEARKAHLEAYLHKRIAQVLSISPAHLDKQQPISSLGLDSLMAVQLQHAVENELGVNLPMASFLEDSTIAELASVLLQAQTDPTGETTNITPGNPADLYPLSPGQRALWFLHQLAPKSAAYHIVNAVKLPMQVDAQALERAFQALVMRHPTLRTSFVTVQNEPWQQVYSQATVNFQVEDASEWDEAQLKARLTELAHQPFDLTTGPLLRVCLFVRGPQEYVLLLALHHIISDLWSMSVLLQELGELYRAEALHIPAALPPLPLQYADYVHWQSDMLAGKRGEQLWNYWRQQLGGEIPMLNLPIDHPRPAVQTYRGAAHAFTLNKKLSRQLKALAQTEKVTLYTLLLAAFQVWMHRLSGQDDIWVGSPTMGRTHAGLTGLVGYFVNPIVLRTDLAGNPPFRALLGRTHATILAALSHQDYPFVMLVERLQPQRDLSRSPLFQVAFAMQKAPLDHGQNLTDFALSKEGAQVTVGGLTLEAMALPQQIAQFDLTLLMGEQDENLSASLQYNTDLFDATTIARLVAGFQTLLEGVSANPAQPLSKLPLLPETEERRLLEVWNDTRKERSGEQSIQSLFEAQVERTPDAVAVLLPTSTGENAITYRELNRRANQVAYRLTKLGVGPDVLVGLYMERSLEMVVSLLGILKVGGAYLPLDPAYPQERLTYMLETVGDQMKVLLTQQSLASRLPPNVATVLCLDSDWAEIAQEYDCNPITGASPENLAYLIFTSGSTGKPKGVLITAKGLLNLCLWYQAHCPITDESRVLLVLSFSFDACYKNIFTPLIAGGRLVLAPSGFYDAVKLVDVIESQGITTINATPSMIQPVIELARKSDYRSLSSLRYLGLGGEALHLAPLRSWLNSPRCRCALHNIYGPTECTDISTSYHILPDKLDALETVSIGAPIDNMRAYVLDRQNNCQPIGVTGELCLSGDGLARGYLKQPGITAEKFIEHPFIPGERLYRTGDQARWLPDGNLEFLGRMDHQVKVRGFRIELGEIESALRQHPAIDEALVVARGAKSGAGPQQLIAYLISPPPAPSISDLRNFLKTSLPEYMLPAYFVFLEHFPLTPSGKVDQQALPAPQDFHPAMETAYAAPQNELEQQIVAIWQEALKVERVGVNDNFFDLGGHSLSMTQVHIRLQEALCREINLVDLFRYPTVGALTQYLSQAAGSSQNAPEQEFMETPLMEGRQRLRQQFERRQRGDES